MQVLQGKDHLLTQELALPPAQHVVATRRDLHRHAEPRCRKYRTAAKVVASLRAPGWEVRHGRPVVDCVGLGVPPLTDLRRHETRTASLGADPAIPEDMRDGHTGVAGMLRRNRAASRLEDPSMRPAPLLRHQVSSSRKGGGA